MNESVFQSKVIAVLKSRGAWVFNIHGGGDPGRGMQRSGVPDLLVIHRQWKGFLELKVNNRKLMPIQQVVCREIVERWFPVYVLRYNNKFRDMMIEDYSGNKLGPSDFDDLLDNLIVISQSN
jgi:hypothetical protein